MVAGEEVELVAADGMRLAATRFRPSGPAHAATLVAGATAVPRGFYRRFAAHAAAAGLETLTLDYRGTGGSRPASLRGFRMRFADWARLDIPAALDALAGPRPVHVVGHSYGGSAFGLVPGTERVASLYAFGAGSGWDGWMSPGERLRVRFLWDVAGPALTALLGYLPWSRLMSGEDLPTGAFRDWRSWCRHPDFVLGDPAEPEARAQYASVRIPVTLATSTDDPWATPRSRDAILAGYTGATRRAVDIDPAAHGLDRIGHMGYFRAGAEPLWDDALAALSA